jgi:hypothetical protein
VGLLQLIGALDYIATVSLSLSLRTMTTGDTKAEQAQ